MAKVKIVKDGVKGADDGATVRAYAKGVIYDVTDALAEVFIEAGEAEEVEDVKPTVTEKVKTKKETAAKSVPAVPVPEPEPVVPPAVEPTEPEPVVPPAVEPTAPEPVVPPAAEPPTTLPGLPTKAPGK